MTTKLALVTGGNGFVGCHVVRALIARGDRVRVLTRENADLSALDGLPVEKVRGDLRQFDSIASAVKGCNEVYHVAADYRLWLRDPAPMYASNVTGTQNILRAAASAGVSRIVYTSTVGALGIPHGGVGREDTPSSLADMPGHYKRSKYMAEQAALEAARAGVPVVIVNPSTPIGALDFKPTPTGRIIVDFLNRRMPAYVDTGLNIVDVEDVASGHLLAAERGRIGEKYILGGENFTLKEFLQRLAAISGMPAPKVRIPYAFAFGYALGAEAFARTVSRRAPRASLTEVRMSRKRMFFDSSKARAELGYSAGPIDKAISAAIEFFKSRGSAKSAA
ncbi:MAG: hopanoid-associated sugar epimerase [Candidatus Binatus sp.]|jgi:dihydroflavonol-4-reductase